MVTKTEAIKAFLTFRAPRELAELYREEMEVQVNAAPAGGDPVEDETVEGRRLKGFRDPRTGETWKSFRIPWADGRYEDSELLWNLDARAECVGLSGWNWQACQSEWVGIDFDSAIGHQKGLTDDQLREVVATVTRVPWVTVRRSRGGKGIHLYVFFDEPVETVNRAEHAALARSVLHLISQATGVDLRASVDVLGGMLWVWHHQVKAGGLTLIKQGEPLRHVSANWRDHLTVTLGKATRACLNVSPSGDVAGDDDLVGLTRQVPLDVDHKRLLAWFVAAAGRGACSWWDNDRNMLVCHTRDLEVAHGELKLKGVFKTTAASAAFAGWQNCFAFPVRNGGWVVRRHGRGTAEHATWTRDANGWTRCTYGRAAELRAVAAANKGQESSRGEYVFKTGKEALKALEDLGVPMTTLPSLPLALNFRPAELEQHDAGRLLISVQREASDVGIDGWLPSRKGDRWELLVPMLRDEGEGEPPDDLLRHVVSGGKDAGWFLQARGTWINEPRQNAAAFLVAQGVKRPDVEPVFGKAVTHYWELVNQPFSPEYPGNRRWNKFGARLAITPIEGPHPTWNAVLSHVGRNLTPALLKMPWAVKHGIKSGRAYLELWCASMFQQPLEPTPYLFLYGPQASGKSTLHEALSVFFTAGYVRADTALTSTGRFNAELAGSVLCVIEETNLRVNRGAYDRIKDWATGKTISIHTKGATPYDLRNSCHWIQCANSADHVPIMPGDTRIVMCFVDLIDPDHQVPKSELLGLLHAEAGAFLYTMLHLELPPPSDRLRIPVVETQDKTDQMMLSRSELETFLEESVLVVPGSVIPFEEFYERFILSMAVGQRGFWTKRRVGREFNHPQLCKGRWGGGGQIHIGNACWPEEVETVAKDQVRLVLQAEKLVRADRA